MLNRILHRASLILGVQRRRPTPTEFDKERKFLTWLGELRDGRSEEKPFATYCLRMWERSHAQLFQDLMVLFFTDEKRNGFFVEFGACDGKMLSNTYLLEKEFGWNGIVAEPARSWEADIRINRTCKIDTRCVWSVSGRSIEFNETTIPEFSTIDALSSCDIHAELRRNRKRYTVHSISLLDLLQCHEAPSHIDYLSIDTEGSEFEILKDFDFGRYWFTAISVEHNYNEEIRTAIFKLLTRQGYKRVLVHLSQWDDWYICR